jgi:hypothetical protein
MTTEALIDGPDPSAASPRASMWSRAAPGLLLMILAPTLAEILPGATRFSAIFVLPIEICVWGGGVLFIRYAVRRWRLGWRNMLLLALALAVAEECLIQQTSLAPLVVQIKGQVYARALGVNYVYLLWALVYESVFVVFAPVYLTELIYPRRRDGLWLNKTGMVVVAVLFALGSFLAWFSWTQIARPKVFHVPLYNPPLTAVLIAATVIALLIFCALGPYRHALAKPGTSDVNGIRPHLPTPWLIGAMGFLCATLWYCFVLLAFGIAPQFPPAIAVAGEILLSAAILALLPRWTAHPLWTEAHQFATLFGVILGSMGLSFVGFIGSLPLDLYFKIGADAIAIVLLSVLGARLRGQPSSFSR